MKRTKIKFTVMKEETGYSATAQLKDSFIGTQAEHFEMLQEEALEAVNLAFEEDGREYVIEDIQFEYDLDSFFHFYKVINAKALAARIGMNQSLLAQYIKGIKKPSPVQTKRILKGVQDIGRELSEVRFVI